MAPSAPKIPENTWDQHKQLISDLIQSHSKPQIIQILRNEHGLAVTISQLEARLKVWGIRKNLSQAEWSVVLDKLDEIKATTKHARVVISGRVIQDHSIDRVRRYRARKGNGGSPLKVKRLDFSQTEIEFRKHDGQWDKFTDFLPQSPSRNSRAGMPQESQPQQKSPTRQKEANPRHSMSGNTNPTPQLNGFSGICLSSVGSMLDMTEPFNADPSPGSVVFAQWEDINLAAGPWQALLHDNARPFELPSSGNNGDLLTSSESHPPDPLALWGKLPLPSVDIEHAMALGNEPLVRWNGFYLRNLPFAQFEAQLMRKGTVLSGPWFVTPPVGQKGQLVRYDHVQDFMRCLYPTRGSSSKKVAATSTDGRGLMSEYRRIKSRLGSLLAQRLADVGQPEHYGVLISEEEMLNTHFNRILISSLVNGSAGLQDIPTGAVLKHLMRYRHTSSILLEFLRHSRSHVAKSLAESLFRAAIEAEDALAVGIILQSPCIDVNQAYYHEYDIVQPIIRAAVLKNPEVVKTLRKAGAVVKKPEPCCDKEFLDLPRYLNIKLKNFDAGIEDRQAIIQSTKEILQAGLEITYEDLDEALLEHEHEMKGKNARDRKARDTLRGELVFLIAEQFSRHSHIEFLRISIDFGIDGMEGRECLLSRLAKQLEDADAAELTRNFIHLCKQQHNGRCLSSNEEEVEWTLVTAAKFGKLQLVQLLLPHSKHLHRVLSAAIRSRSADVVDAVLAYDPDIDAPAHSIDSKLPFDRTICGCVTSLSEAVMAGNDRMIQMIQDAGYMERLEHGNRFAPALTAAAKTNDLELMRSLLGRHHHPHPAELGPALVGAATHSNEEATEFLLDAGASIFDAQQYAAISDDGQALLAACTARNKQIIYGLLDGITARFLGGIALDGHNSNIMTCIFRSVAEWGDEATMTALLSTFPGTVINGHVLISTLEHDYPHMFDFLVKSGRVRPEAITKCLEHAIIKQDENIISRLISMGADCGDDDVLEAAANASLPILKLILSSKTTSPLPRPLTLPGRGKGALKTAIKMGSQGLELAKRLLQCTNIHTGMPEYKRCLILTSRYRWPLSEATSSISLAMEAYGGNNAEDIRLVELFLRGMRSPDEIVKSGDLVGHDFLAQGEKVIQVEERPARATPPALGMEGYPSSYFANETAMLLAIRLQSAKLVKLLIDYGADVNFPATCRILRTPLQKACEVGSLEIVKLLLDSGAHPNGKPARCQGFTALQLAAMSGNCNIAAELLDRGADLHQPALKAGGRWPLEGAAQFGRLEMIEFLWRASMDIGKGGFDESICNFAMKIAEKYGHLACRDLIKDLMENGVDYGREHMDPVLDLSMDGT